MINNITSTKPVRFPTVIQNLNENIVRSSIGTEFNSIDFIDISNEIPNNPDIYDVIEQFKAELKDKEFNRRIVVSKTISYANK